MSQLCKNWSFSFNISPSDEHPELISFRIDWLDFLAAQGTLKSLLQHHSSSPHPLNTRSCPSLDEHSHPQTWPRVLWGQNQPQVRPLP